MNRLGLMHPSTLTGKHHAEVSALYDAFSEHIDKYLDGEHTTYVLPSTGALVGPFAIQLLTPQVGSAYLDLTNAVRELPGLARRAREIIALVVAAFERSEYQLYCHGPQARQEGITQNELDALRAGLFSQTFSIKDRAAYSLARELCASSGPLPDRIWNEAIVSLGRDGVLAAVMLTAQERFVSTLLRGFDAQVPAPRERKENQS